MFRLRNDLKAAPSPIGTIDANVIVIVCRQMDSTAVSSFGLGRRPARSTRSSKDHHSMQTMAADGTASFKKPGIPRNASPEKPVQVALQDGESLM